MKGIGWIGYVAIAQILFGIFTQVTGEVVSDFRFISYDDLLPTIDRFSQVDVTSYSQLLFDTPRFQVLVGARDYIFRLSLLGLQKLEESHWPAPQHTVAMCQQKGQTEDDCRNYIKVLIAKDNKIFACGTHAFSPKCSWREIDNISNVVEELNGMGRCPHSPHQNITALISSTGDYYVGSVIDFSARDPAIFRFNGRKNIGLRTVQYNHKWLSEPNFVASYDIGNFTYFIFRETAVEYINCGKIIYSRIARVCKNDEGGQYLLKDNWTTFLKARLNCSVPGEYPFYYNEIQSVFYLEREDVLYATFSTPSNSIMGSAVCAFNMSSIERAFHGPFKYQNSPSSAWERQMGHQAARRHFQCETPASNSHKHSLESERYQLMDEAVQPVTVAPFVTVQLEQFTHIAVDVVETQHHNAIHVMFVVTREGTLKKMMILPRTRQVCLIEVLKLFPGDHSQSIRTIKFLKDMNSLYIGTDTSVMRVPVQRCNRFKTKRACLNSMDPYCGWVSVHQKCDIAPQGNPLSSFWQQAFPSCPVLTEPVDGGWTSWGSWHECSRLGVISSGSQCLCRVRQCSNPAPKNGGHDCEGAMSQVSNCTQDGEWTEWSAWSDCSQSCGLARKTRKRTCGNPSSAYGGLPCEGSDRDMIYCTSNPPCPVPVSPSIDGQWSEWSKWDECSVPCGRGYQMRRRRCDTPPPQNGGRDCSGCPHEYRSCNHSPCPEHRKSTLWTPWLRGNSSKDGHYEMRFRFTCKANVPDAKFIRVGNPKKEERFCLEDSRNCMASEFLNNDGDWSEWSPWTSCSAPCGGGIQYRVRACDNPRPTGSGLECLGENRLERACNTHLCHNSEGWDEWTVWSECDNNGYQFRKRQCQLSEAGSESCQGPDRQQRMCLDDDDNEEDNEISPMAVQSASGVQVGHLVAASFVFFFIGAFLAGFGVYYFKVKRPRNNLMRGNKHFINRPSSPNLYTPPKDCLSKNNYSSGTLTKKGIPLTKESTLKRNGHKAQLSSEMFE